MASVQELRSVFQAVVVAVVVCCFLRVDQVNGDAVSDDDEAPGWNYNTNELGGPEGWKLNYTECGGVMQSPIEIETEHVLYGPELEMFNLTDYRITADVTMKLVNKGGHTAEVIYGGRDLYLRGGSLPDDYHLVQFHFHWGSTADKGSEHMLDKKHFPMEMHIVHYQRKLETVENALPHPAGLAVLGFFFEIGQKNANFDKLLMHFDMITEPDEEVDIPTFPLTDLLPQTDRIDYYRYAGSLTTPPCYESVIWSLATETIEISQDQLNIFRSLHDAENRSLVNDYRPVQARNYRTVLTTHWDYRTDSGDDAAFVTASKLTVLALVSICLLSLHRF